ncbi:hypothetical protein Bbelb_350030 [Branchiostoma belcheri]|nr:hypothetical protein Bbelb_350030 [Branchiostoma belcheri]
MVLIVAPAGGGLRRGPPGTYYLYDQDLLDVVRDTYPSGEDVAWMLTNQDNRPTKEVGVEDLFDDKIIRGSSSAVPVPDWLIQFIFVIMLSDEERKKKPYALPIQFISYHSLRDQWKEDFKYNYNCNLDRHMSTPCSRSGRINVRKSSTQTPSPDTDDHLQKVENDTDNPCNVHAFNSFFFTKLIKEGPFCRKHNPCRLPSFPPAASPRPHRRTTPDSTRENPAGGTVADGPDTLQQRACRHIRSPPEGQDSHVYDPEDLRRLGYDPRTPSNSPPPPRRRRSPSCNRCSTAGMEAEALEDVKALHSEERDDIKTVLDTLKRAFRDTVPAHIVMGRFYTRRQEDDESDEALAVAEAAGRTKRAPAQVHGTCCSVPAEGTGQLSASQSLLCNELDELCNELDELRFAVNGRASGGATGYGYRPGCGGCRPGQAPQCERPR